MANPRLDNLVPLLAAMIRQLFEADALDDVRVVTAHGARLIAPYDALTLRERGISGLPEVTMRRGEELDANAKALERHLCQEAAERGRMVSTLDRLESHQAQSAADAYVRQYGLCLTRPLRVFGEEFGLLTLHYKGRPALFDAELHALGTFADWAAIALYNARAPGRRSRCTTRARARICATSLTRTRSPGSAAGAGSTLSSRACATASSRCC